MKNKTMVDSNEVLNAFKKAIKEQNRKKSMEVTYLDKDGNIRRFKSKIKKGDDKR